MKRFNKNEKVRTVNGKKFTVADQIGSMVYFYNGLKLHASQCFKLRNGGVK